MVIISHINDIISLLITNAFIVIIITYPLIIGSIIYLLNDFYYFLSNFI